MQMTATEIALQKAIAAMRAEPVSAPANLPTATEIAARDMAGMLTRMRELKLMSHLIDRTEKGAKAVGCMEEVERAIDGALLFLHAAINERAMQQQAAAAAQAKAA